MSVMGGKKPVLVSHHDLISNKNGVFKKLSDQGARLVTAKAQGDLLTDIQNYKPNMPLFRVAEEIGLFDDCFILPDCTIPALPDKVEICLNDIPTDIISKYKTSGTPKGWLELAGYAVGNTRMLFAFALNFVGPVSAIWPREFVAFQFKADPSSGKGAIAAVCTSTWGWDPLLGMKYGFGTNWNTTTNNLEFICKGYNHTILFLDETGVAGDKDSAGKRVDFRKAIMRLDSQTVKGRMTDDGPRGVWNMPVLSTSNLSVLQMLEAGKFGNEKDDVPHRAYCDRLIDIPCPNVGYGMFEHVYDSKNNAKFSERLKKLASKLAQARKYGLGMIFATQLPKGMDNAIVSNCTTHVYGRMSSPATIQATRELMAAKGGAAEDLGRLTTGEFYFSTEGFSRPIKVRTPLCLSWHPPNPPTADEVVQRARKKPV
ncbi:MAG: hypothetical protein DLM68_09825 [Hyphomicrobiales bacterium]|nr:MAG: hypothetical protein DLM68_09825 [Hyphomicrobiales bacterium]